MPSPTASKLERYRDLVDDWPAFLDALARPLPTAIWTNRLRIRAERLRELLVAEGLAPRPLAWNPSAFRIETAGTIGDRWWFRAGLAHAQEEVSQLPALLLDPRPGERILDLCAAPGGKTAQLAAALHNRGTVVANDVRIDRTRALSALIARLGLVNVSTTVHDGGSYPSAAGQFDRVLVDAPCSAEGTARKNPAVLERASDSRERYPPLQRRLLQRAVELCRPGGRIVYSTCTFAPEENELVVDAVLGRFGARLRLLPARVEGLAADPGLDRWQGRRLHPDLIHSLRIWPHRNDTGGFFVAVLEKLGEGQPPEVAAVPDAGLDQLAALLARHGIAPSALAGWTVHRRSSRSLWLTSTDHRPPPAPYSATVGLPLVSTKTRPAKLSTAGALLLAPHAHAQVIDLHRHQLPAYFARDALSLPAAQSAACSGAGHVLVRYRGVGLGTGYWDPRRGALESLFPKHWAGTGPAQKTFTRSPDQG